MIEHFGESTLMSSDFSVAESDEAIYAKSPCVMARVIRTVERALLDRSEVGLNDVEPKGTGRLSGQRRDHARPPGKR